MNFRAFVYLLALAAPLSACGGDSGASTTPAPVVTSPPVVTPPPVAMPPASPDYTAFSVETPVAITGYADDAMEPFISKDGQYLLFNNSNADSTKTDLFYATRIDDQTFTTRGTIVGANSSALDAVASMDTSGNLYFISTRSYDTSLSTVYSAQFSSGSVTPPKLVLGISLLQFGMVNFDAEINGDGNTLWFDDGKFSGSAVPETASIAVADRQGAGFVRRADSATMLAKVNAVGLNYAPSISSDGLELFFTRIADLTNLAPLIYRASRTSVTAAFAEPQKVAAISGFVEAPSISWNGHILYYHKRVNGKFGIYLVRR